MPPAALSNEPPGIQPTLVNLQPGAEATVIGLDGGHGLRHRLMGMGLTVGSRVQVLRSGGRGPVLVAVGAARLAIGRGMAERIAVRPESQTREDG